MKLFVPTIVLPAFCGTAPSYASMACEVKSGVAMAAPVERYASAAGMPGKAGETNPTPSMLVTNTHPVGRS